jgi:hypothetical protein
VLWGSIGLLRSLFTGQEIGDGNVNKLAGALLLILVRIPVFLLHWRRLLRVPFLCWTDYSCRDLVSTLNWRFWATTRPGAIIWLVYGLVFVVAGLEQLIQFVLTIWGAIGLGPQALLANSLSLLLVGMPVWLYTSHLIWRSMVDPAERDFLLRLIVLYLLVFIGVIGSMTAVGVVLSDVLRMLLGAPFVLLSFPGEIAVPFSLAASMGWPGHIMVTA